MRDELDVIVTPAIYLGMAGSLMLAFCVAVSGVSSQPMQVLCDKCVISTPQQSVRKPASPPCDRDRSASQALILPHDGSR